MKLNICQRLVNNPAFDQAAVIVIIINAVLIGVELNHTSPEIKLIQNLIIAFFVVELLIRFLGRQSYKEYFTDGWNYFDVFVVAISLVPETAVSGADVSVLRALRVLRVFRALRAIDELRLITTVLLKSIKSLVYSGALFFIFMYVYAVIGVSMFRNPDYANSPNFELNPTQPDPYGNLGEAMFSLFRILTGEDWTDLRYNLIDLHTELSGFVTFYHVSWMIVSGFLLINLVVGAVINNYDKAIEEAHERDEESKSKLARRRDDR
ncbi:MAG: ion transporter [Rhodospirillales bacterium]